MQKIFVNRLWDEDFSFIAVTIIADEAFTCYGETADDAARQIQTVLYGEVPPITEWEVVDLSRENLVAHLWEVPTYDPHYAEGARWYAWVDPSMGVRRGKDRKELLASITKEYAQERNQLLPAEAFRIIPNPPASR